jgi:hypothetical protein
MRSKKGAYQWMLTCIRAPRRIQSGNSSVERAPTLGGEHRVAAGSAGASLTFETVVSSPQEMVYPPRYVFKHRTG